MQFSLDFFFLVADSRRVVPPLEPLRLVVSAVLVKAGLFVSLWAMRGSSPRLALV
jgi:hypothetical protein